MPFEIIQASEKLVDWKQTMKSEVVIFDLREEREKANVRLNRQVTTFKQGRSDIWLDRPYIVKSAKTEISRWKSSIYHIKKVNQILFIKPSLKDKN